MGRSDLERLSKEELIELVLRLQRPQKTSRTSSKPQAALSDLFGLTLSQGGLMNLLRRAGALC